MEWFSNVFSEFSPKMTPKPFKNFFLILKYKMCDHFILFFISNLSLDGKAEKSVNFSQKKQVKHSEKKKTLHF